MSGIKKIKFSLIVLHAFIAWPVFSQNSSLLWEISGKGLENPSFLYGTMHVKDKRVFQFGDSVLPCFNRCKAYAGEMILNDINPLDLMGRVMMPGDTSLKILMNKTDYDFVKKTAEEKLGPMAGMVDNMKPIFTSALLSEMSVEQDSSQTLDEYLQKIAKDKGMELIGIETMEEQMAALDHVSLKEQAQILLKTLKEEGKGKNNIDQMFEIYMKQDLDGMLKFMKDYDMPAVMNQSILLKRNYVMADRIAKMINKQSTFIGIGAAHLPGKEGVIELLRSKGYKVRPVFSKYSEKDKSLVKQDASGWYSYTSKDKSFKVLMPGKPTEVDEVDLGHAVTSSFTLEPGTQNLFAATNYPHKESGNSTAFFNKTIKDFKESGLKITGTKKFQYKDKPAMELDLMKGVFYLRIIYYYVDDKNIVELSITGSKKEEVRSGNAEKFFNSLEFIK